MLSMTEKTLCECFKKEIESEVSIVYKKEAGIDGKTTLSANGSGPMLFHGICTILKKIAQAEGAQMGNPQTATKYVKLVCSTVCEELRKGDWNGR